MKISYDWMKDYLPVSLAAGELSEILTAIGLEVSSVDHIESIRGGLHGVVAGEVLTCGKHPNADRLSLCTVDVGTETPLSIVCGAPNVAAGQMVWVAQVGTKLYLGDSDESLEIKKAKVRGEFSEGMICAEDELGLGNDHSGIMVLPEDVRKGTAARDYYNVSEDVVFDIDLTPNRSDATSHLGVAEDVAAYLQINTPDASQVTWPDVDLSVSVEQDPKFQVEVLNHDACPRYSGILIENIKVSESPLEMQNRLRAIGVRPINNIVDITNYVLHEMGQPLHAFDADRIAGQKIVVKTLPEGSRFVSLDEVDRTLTDEDLMICDGEGKGMCIAGVFGGIGSGVTENTTRVFLESAHFDAEWVRKSSMHHLLRTDAARTFEKSTDPNICVTALMRAAQLIRQHAGAELASGIYDLYPNPIHPAKVKVRWQRINHLIGVELDQKTVRDILNALNMKIASEDDDAIVVEVPTNKADVTREADVIEEILRIYGFNNVPLNARMEIALTWEDRVTRDKLRNTLGAFLASQGFLEMMGLSLTETANVSDGFEISDDQLILIENTSNVSLNLMRPDMLVTALEAVQYNQNRRQDNVRMFEFGNTYRKKGEDIEELEHLTLTISGTEVPANWRLNGGDADYYTLKKYVQAVLQRVGLVRYQSTRLDDPRFAHGVRVHLGNNDVAVFGKVSKTLADKFDLRKDVIYADIHLDPLLRTFKKQALTVQEVSRYPGMVRDLSVELPLKVEYAELEKILRKAGGKQLQEVELFDVYESDDLKREARKSYAVQLVFEDPGRTMTDGEIDSAVAAMIKAISKQLDGKLRG